MADFTEIEAYLDYLREHGRRETTIRAAGDTLRHLVRVLESGGRPTVISALTLDDVRWLANNLHVKDSVKAEQIRILSRASISQGGQDFGKQLDILYNRPDPNRIWITVEEFATLYRAAKPEDRMVLVLGAFMGLRRFEIAGLRDGDIDLFSRKMTVRGKGHGPDGLVSVMSIPDEVMREIEDFRRYKATHHNPPQDDDHLVQFVRYGRWVPVQPITVAQHIQHLGESCGIKVTTHSLRRLFATTLVNSVGAEYETVRRLMRHADISTTLRCYVRPDPVKQKTAIAGLMGIYSEAINTV